MIENDQGGGRIGTAATQSRLPGQVLAQMYIHAAPAMRTFL